VLENNVIGNFFAHNVEEPNSLPSKALLELIYAQNDIACAVVFALTSLPVY